MLNNPEKIYKLICPNATNDELQKFLRLCNIKKGHLDYNKIFKVKRTIEGFVSFNSKLDGTQFSFVYFIWNLGRIDTDEKLHIAKSVTVFGRNSKYCYNTKFLLVPNIENITVSDLLLCRAKCLLLSILPPSYNTLQDDLFVITKHYPKYSHFVIFITDKLKFDEIKFLHNIATFSYVFVIYLNKNVYFIFPNFYVRKMKWWKNVGRRKQKKK